MDNTNGQLKKGAILSYVNLALSSLIPLLYTPIMLRMLGEAEYGLYSLSGAAVGYLSLLSFGFGSTILRYLSLYRAKGEVENERKAFGFFLLVYTIVAVLVMAGGVILSNNIEGIFHRGLTPDELLKMKKLVLIMAFSTAITFPVSVFSSVVMAHERYVFKKLIEMLSTILAPVANLIALYLGYSSVGMAVAGVVTHTLMLPIYACYCFSVLKIHPIFTVMPWRIVSEMLRFTGFVFLATIVDMLFWSTDKLLLGAMTSSIAVAVYNIGGGQPENLLDFVQILQEELVRAGVLPKDFDFEAHQQLVPMQPGDVPTTYADATALERDFGFTPKITLREGLRAFAQWYKSYYNPAL